MLLEESHDCLGWEKIVCGWISKLYLQVAKDSINLKQKFGTPESWGQHLVVPLMQAMHKQWLFRNAHVHFCKQEGLTQTQYEEVFSRVLEMMEIDSKELLAKHRYSWIGYEFHVGTTS